MSGAGAGSARGGSSSATESAESFGVDRGPSHAPGRGDGWTGGAPSSATDVACPCPSEETSTLISTACPSLLSSVSAIRGCASRTVHGPSSDRHGLAPSDPQDATAPIEPVQLAHSRFGVCAGHVRHESGHASARRCGDVRSWWGRRVVRVCAWPHNFYLQGH
jgi:hypothetical protein